MWTMRPRQKNLNPTLGIYRLRTRSFSRHSLWSFFELKPHHTLWSGLGGLSSLEIFMKPTHQKHALGNKDHVLLKGYQQHVYLLCGDPWQWKERVFARLYFSSRRWPLRQEACRCLFLFPCKHGKAAILMVFVYGVYWFHVAAVTLDLPKRKFMEDPKAS